MSRYYRSIQPLLRLHLLPNMVVNQLFWNSLLSMKSNWKTNTMPMGQTWYVTNPYIIGATTTMNEFFLLSLSTFGKKSVISDSALVKHRWYMDDTILQTLETGDFNDDDDVFVVNRTWFYLDYNNQNTYYPTNMIHFINVIPDLTDICEKFWLSINHSKWYPKKNDYRLKIDGFLSAVSDNDKKETVVLRVRASDI